MGAGRPAASPGGGTPACWALMPGLRFWTKALTVAGPATSPWQVVGSCDAHTKWPLFARVTDRGSYRENLNAMLVELLWAPCRSNA